MSDILEANGTDQSVIIIVSRHLRGCGAENKSSPCACADPAGVLLESSFSGGRHPRSRRAGRSRGGCGSGSGYHRPTETSATENTNLHG